MFSETAVKEAMNKKLSQLLSNKSFEEIDKDNLTPEQLQQVACCYKMGDFPEANQQWHKGHQVPFLWQRLLTIHPRHRHPDIRSYTFINNNASTTHKRQHQAVFTVVTTDVASAFLKTPVDEEVIVQPPKEYYHNRPNT
eukprot:6282260-Amphidinium_carterae.1